MGRMTEGTGATGVTEAAGMTDGTGATGVTEAAGMTEGTGAVGARVAGGCTMVERWRARQRQNCSDARVP